MRLATFAAPGEPPRLGVVAGDRVIDLHAADREIPDAMLPFLALGARGFERARAVLARPPSGFALADVRLWPPVPRPVDRDAALGPRPSALGGKARRVDSPPLGTGDKVAARVNAPNGPRPSAVGPRQPQREDAGDGAPTLGSKPSTQS